MGIILKHTLSFLGADVEGDINIMWGALGFHALRSQQFQIDYGTSVSWTELLTKLTKGLPGELARSNTAKA